MVQRDECAAMESLWTIVAIRSAVIRRVVIVAVWTCRGGSDVDADLSLCLGSACSNEERSDSDQRKKRDHFHERSCRSLKRSLASPTSSSVAIQIAFT